MLRGLPPTTVPEGQALRFGPAGNSPRIRLRVLDGQAGRGRAYLRRSLGGFVLELRRTESLDACYQQADEATMLEVATEATYRRSVLPPYYQSRDVAQSGSAPEWGSGGRRFESGRPD